MKLADFCQFFPTDRSTWPALKLSKAIPVHLREVLYPKMGHLFSSNDRSRAKSSSRLGLSLRPFQAGDRIAAISLQYLMRTGEIMSRIDNAQGQVTARIFCISEESLDFKSEESKCTKGQVLLGVAGILETLHLRQNHAVKIVFSQRSDFTHHLRLAARNKQGLESIYVISDFLNGTLATDLLALRNAGYAQAQFLCIRDLYESPSANNPLAEIAFQLEPFMANKNVQNTTSRSSEKNGSQSFGFSGKRYITNLIAEQEKYLKLTRHAQCTFHLATETSELYAIVKAMSESYMMTAQYRHRTLSKYS